MRRRHRVPSLRFSRSHSHGFDATVFLGQRRVQETDCQRSRRRVIYEGRESLPFNDDPGKFIKPPKWAKCSCQTHLAGVDHVDYETLRIIKQMTRHLEVRDCSEHQWQDAILRGFAAWRQLRDYRKGENH